MAYKSDTDIGIGIAPDLAPEHDALYPAMQPVYNALHILNARLSGFAGGAFAPPTVESSPSAGFSLRPDSFWAPCTEQTVVNRIVHIRDGIWSIGAGYGGIQIGDPDSSSAYKRNRAVHFGYVIEDPVIHEGKRMAHIAWPPFILDSEGITSGPLYIGKRIYVDGNGILMVPEDRKNEDVAVGLIVRDDAILITNLLPW